MSDTTLIIFGLIVIGLTAGFVVGQIIQELKPFDEHKAWAEKCWELDMGYTCSKPTKEDSFVVCKCTERDQHWRDYYDQAN